MFSKLNTDLIFQRPLLTTTLALEWRRNINKRIVLYTVEYSAFVGGEQNALSAQQVADGLLNYIFETELFSALYI